MAKYFLSTKLRTMILACCCLAVAACVSSTPYGPAVSNSGFGYADQRIDENRFRVTFRGNSSTPRDTVENFLLLRSAELTVEGGYDYFIVVENDTEARSYFTSLYGSYYGSYHGGFGPFYGGRRRFGAFPYYPYGFGFGPGFGSGFYGDNIRENTQYSAIAFISLHRGQKPSDEPAAFAAREVITNLRPLVVDAGS